jgi:GST-like protein
MQSEPQPELYLMADLSDFPITRQYPAAHPDRIQLYSFPTPNGVKASIMLEEIGLPYEAHLVDITKNETWTPEYLSLNPNGKIPAILDPDGPDGKPLALWESGAILAYLADKTGRLIPGDPAGRYETLQWVFWQMAAVGPMVGQLGFFHKFAGREYEDKRPRDRFATEAKRLLGVLDGRLKDRAFIMGDEFTIADIALIGWVRAIPAFYEASDLVDWNALTEVPGWVARCEDRPAVKRGLTIPARP